jgi:hypothetical protein
MEAPTGLLHSTRLLLLGDSAYGCNSIVIIQIVEDKRSPAISLDGIDEMVTSGFAQIEGANTSLFPASRCVRTSDQGIGLGIHKALDHADLVRAHSLRHKQGFSMRYSKSCSSVWMSAAIRSKYGP